MAAMERFSIKANGQRYEGWKSIHVSHSLELAASEIALGVAEWPGDIELYLEDELEAFVLDGHGRPEKVFGGHFEDVQGDESATDSSVTISGRSYTSALIDNVSPLGSIQGLSFLELARKLANPYGIAINSDLADIAAPNAKPLAAVRAQPGETVFEVLERIARREGVLLTDAFASPLVSQQYPGTVVITASDAAGQGDPLVYGQNIVKRSFAFSVKERFQSYTAKGMQTVKLPGKAAQATGPGETDTATKAAAAETEVVPVTITTFDPAIRRRREMLVTGESDLKHLSAETRTLIEASRRIGQGIKATYTVLGWRQSSGALWRPNLRVSVVDPFVGWTGREALLVSAVDLHFNESDGETAELTVVPAVAFARPTSALVVPDGLEGKWARRRLPLRLPARRRG